LGVLADNIKARYAPKPRKPWGLLAWAKAFVAFLVLLVVAFLARACVGPCYYITQSHWITTQTPDDESPDIGVDFSEFERRPVSSPIPTVPGLEWDEPKSATFSFYRLKAGESVTILSIKRRYDADSAGEVVPVDLRLSQHPARVGGTLKCGYFEIAPDQPNVQYVEFELQFQMHRANRETTESPKTVVFRFQREKGSRLSCGWP
jgi:hypothetical protein